MISILIGAGLACALGAHFYIVLRHNAEFDRIALILRSSPSLGSVDLDTLPPVVRGFAGRAGAAADGPAVVRLTQKAKMRMVPDKPFQDIEAEQVISTRAPGFIWRASGSMGFGVSVTVVDRYVKGEGLLDARLLGSVPVAHAANAEMARDEAMRYLAEIPWAPDSILNAPSLSWRELDANRVEVAVETAGGTAAVQILFDEAGDICAIAADARGRTVGRDVVPTPWRGEFSDYKQYGRYRIPSRGKVSWLLGDELFTYWEGEITHYTVM